MDALHHCLSEYFGPVGLPFSAVETPARPPARAAQQLIHRNPYIVKPKLAPVLDPSLEVETVELTPALCALTLETIPAPHGIPRKLIFI